MIARDEATERQVQAALPSASTWLAANAGSGKTKVLTDRVARLLLTGVQPQHILCLTYTKAAASEMQNRLFRRLGEWAMLADADLSRALESLGIDGGVTTDQLSHARTLFARAIETPGGLKIQTIHSFCASLLRRFPLEAGVSPQFGEIEDRAASLLRDDIVDQFADGPQAPLVAAVARYLSDNDFSKLTAAIVGRREAFEAPLGWADLTRAFDLPDGFDEAALEKAVFDGTEAELFHNLRQILLTGKATDIKNANILAGIPDPDSNDLPTLEKLFLFASGKNKHGAKIGSIPTKDLAAKHPALVDALNDLMQRVAEARQPRLGLAAARKSLALHQFAAAFLPEYARRKQLHGWLDFDDQILKARNLLNDPAVAAWVLYRLDGGIDHILVDEAQDTSPAQWDVIEKLAQEFTSGLGARPEAERTIFVVGDKKQSIYSFQGADPGAFDRMQAEFSARLGSTGKQLESFELEFSFRSSYAILRLVDLVFREQSAAGFAKGSQHRAFKDKLPGRVDLWPQVPAVDDSDDREWTDPVDRPGTRHHTVILAERIADTIRQLTTDGTTIPIDGPDGSLLRRKVQPGDFLILVQRRSDLFAEIIRACKAADLPIVGADRLKVGAELAVKDLGALLSVLATPEDDLSLAAALRSALFGWSEQDLFDLAHRRDPGDYLWVGLRNRATEFPQTMAILDDLMAKTDFLRPYDLIERILTRHDGRRRLLARLGPEAEDGINALLSQALAYERSDIPSLTGFLVWMETDDLEIKRQMGEAANMIRVMTVHGAKGLESPIVILPDTGPRNAPSGAEVMMAGDMPLWKTLADQMPDTLIGARDAARDRDLQERMRLLYVALTRAEKWLMVAVAGDLKDSGDSWYQMIEAAMIDDNAATHMFDGEPGLRLSYGDWDALPLVEQQDTTEAETAHPACFAFPAPDPVRPDATLSPSDLGGAKALPGDDGLDEEAAKLRGTRIHLLLEHLPGLPAADWAAAAASILHGTPEAERQSCLQEVRAVLSAPDLATVFEPGALTEVAITAPIGARRIHGTIDRLIVTDTVVLAVDFKSNATVPAQPQACPEGILRQMGAYAAALQQVYPGREIRTAILWTRTAHMMYLPHDLVTDAVRRTPHLDDSDPRS